VRMGSERAWMVEAEKLVDMFRETRNLFLSNQVGCPPCLEVERRADSSGGA
jgi:hypothetical protein